MNITKEGLKSPIAGKKRREAYDVDFGEKRKQRRHPIAQIRLRFSRNEREKSAAIASLERGERSGRRPARRREEKAKERETQKRKERGKEL